MKSVNAHTHTEYFNRRHNYALIVQTLTVMYNHHNFPKALLKLTAANFIYTAKAEFFLNDSNS